jgi:hypothetical protein
MTPSSSAQVAESTESTVVLASPLNSSERSPPHDGEVAHHAAASAWRRSMKRCSDTSANTIGT